MHIYAFYPGRMDKPLRMLLPVVELQRVGSHGHMSRLFPHGILENLLLFSRQHLAQGKIATSVPARHSSRLHQEFILQRFAMIFEHLRKRFMNIACVVRNILRTQRTRTKLTLETNLKMYTLVKYGKSCASAENEINSRYY